MEFLLYAHTKHYNCTICPYHNAAQSLSLASSHVVWWFNLYHHATQIQLVMHHSSNSLSC